MLLRQHSGHAVLGVECLRVNVLPVHEPLDVDVDAAGDDDVGEDGVTVEDDLGLERVGRLGHHGLLHLHCD